MNNLFIFGAGASKEAGGPLMKEFLNVAKDLYRKNPSGFEDCREDIRLVNQAIVDRNPIHAKAKLDVENIESVFGAIELAQIVGKFGDYTQEQITQLRESIINLMVRTLEYSIQFPTEENRIVPTKHYGDFAKLLFNTFSVQRIGNPHVSIITFNYDIALDYALGYYSIPFEYFINDENKETKIPLLKLHGSINWACCEKCGRISTSNPNKFKRSISTSQMRSLQISSSLKTLVCACGEQLKGTSHLVPPSWNKTQYSKEISSVWKKAAIELGKAQNVFVVGYSLPETDSFFRYLYALGAESQESIEKFWVFDVDDSNTVKERYESLVGSVVTPKFYYQQKPFSNAIVDFRSIFKDLYST